MDSVERRRFRMTSACAKLVERQGSERGVRQRNDSWRDLPDARRLALDSLIVATDGEAHSLTVRVVQLFWRP